jgi:hypothetical protein
MPLVLAQPGYFEATSKHFKLSLSRPCKNLDFPEPHF